MGRGGNQNTASQAAASRLRDEKLVAGTPYTEAELVRWADRVLDRLGAGERSDLLAVRVRGTAQLPAAQALRLMGEHRGTDVVLLVAGYVSPERIAELRERGAILAELPGDPPPALEGAPLDVRELAANAGEPERIGERIPWPDRKRAAAEHPELPEEQAWRRLALDELAALG